MSVGRVVTRSDAVTELKTRVVTRQHASLELDPRIPAALVARWRPIRAAGPSGAIEIEVTPRDDLVVQDCCGDQAMAAIAWTSVSAFFTPPQSLELPIWR